MQTVVVGGQARKVGKTAVVAGLIRGLKSFDWTAVKITHHHHDLIPESAGEAAPSADFVLREERIAGGRGDTSRYLAAGARRALWMQARPGSLATAVPALLAALASDRFVLIESNSIRDFLEPDVCLMVLNPRLHWMKSSARKFLRRADALVSAGSFDSQAWPGLRATGFRGKPVFVVPKPGYASPELRRFVCRNLQLQALRPQEADGA